MPTVSVVVPNYNHARFLRKRIGSIFAQTYQDFELILLDDCSTDESRSILSEYTNDSRVRIEFNAVNLGTYNQWNKGVELARGDYVWIAESDDYAHERFLERLIPVLARDSRVAFVYCRSWHVEEDNVRGFVDSNVDPLDPRWGTDFCVDGREECENYFVVDNVVGNTSSAVFRRATYEQVGGADAGLRLCADWKLWTKMALAGKVAYVSEPLNYYRFHSATFRSAILGRYSSLDVPHALERLRVARWILQRVTPTEGAMRSAESRNAYYWVPTVLSLSVPLRSKLAILWLAAKVDPYTVQGVARTARQLLESFGPKRHLLAVWYRTLEWTKPLRYRLGLHRRRRLGLQ
jgi:glycosyltransferase involved in cell wall biosynthesis